MADNIRIIGNISDIQRITRFDIDDTNLFNPQLINKSFGFENDYIELFVYDLNGNLLSINSNYKNFKLPSDSYTNPNTSLPIIEIDPVKDLQDLGYISGEFFTQYNFQTRKISSSVNKDLFVSQISDDRTEIRLKSINLSSDELLTAGEKLINESNATQIQNYFILNFENNIQLIVVNVATDIEDPSILLKLYKPFPLELKEKLRCWISEEIIEPYAFNLNLDTSITVIEGPKLKGPNFDIDIDIKNNPNTEYQNYSSLVSSLTGSSYQNILSYMNDNSYDLNIDYTSFSNFIHFSSAETRVKNFYNKVKQIENYNNNINVITGSTNLLKNEQTASIKLKIDNIVKNFDGFEYYMYFESSSYAWPKSGNIKPYTLLSTGSSIVTSWYNDYTGSAEVYDEDNLDYLYYSLPNYVKNDPGNYQQYYTFIDMIGHYFDNVWIYITSINELYNADNNLEKGVSKDLVYDALRSLGVKLYNAKSNNDFDDYVFGINSGSTLFIDDFSVTSSYLNNIPKKDLLAETYKRIYHNIPLLSKTRGTPTGLKNLITTFGITSSIFSPKEFGGSTKKNEIKGFDNDKITIKNNTITGSVLSPFISLQTSPTSSTEFTSTDLHFIDLSFSPQNQLNTRLSASIAILAPTFSLDDYIGDPALMASSSYQSLIEQNNYFTSASSAVSGSEKPLDYKGFIELVKYFDNSLFKMLKDFVPARANALTGVTIKSSVLERNKIPVYQPNVTNQNIHDAKFAGPTIKQDNTYNFSKLQGDKSSFYTGEISGSYIDVYDYFENSNPNPYLFPTTSLETDTTAYNNYLHSDFNVTLNNVSSSIVSIPRKKVETIYTNINGKIFSSGNEINLNTELQDSYLSLKGHQNSRYDGTKIFSLKYNDYSSASLGYIGDNSYGKTAVIDHHTRKIGLFTQIQENLFFNYPKRNNVFLKYLVDESGSLTELNKKNKHWEEVQNIFKSGDNLVVSQFDSQKYLNQKQVDGNKAIYDSGYSYAPILYYASSDNSLYFDYVGNTLSKVFRITNSGGFISGSSSNKYPISDGKIYNLFRKNLDNADPTYADGNEYYSQPSANTFSTYSIQETSNQRFVANFAIQVEFPSVNLSGSLQFNIKKVGGATLASQSLAVASGFTSTRRTDWEYAKKTGNYYTLPQATKIYNDSGDLVETLSSGTILRSIQAGPAVINYGGYSGCNFVTSAEYWVVEGYYYGISEQYSTCDDIYTLPSVSGPFNRSLYTLPSSRLTNTLYFNVNTDFTQFTVNDKVGFELITGSGGFNTTNFTASVLGYDPNTKVGVLYNTLQENQIGTNPLATDDAGTKPFISGSYLNSLVLNSSLSYFKDYLFLPSGSTWRNSLYNTYGNVENTFSPKVGDYVAVYYPNGYFESSVSNVYFDGNGKLNLDLSNELPSYLKRPTFVDADITKFLYLSKINDETNVVLQFNKTVDQPTSLGFIIPNNLHPDVLANIDNITKEVKQKLVDFGAPDLGSF
jgi:hypothetical protein